MEHTVGFGVDQRVIRHGIELDGQLVVRQTEVLQHRADPLTRRAQRVAILAQRRDIGAIVAVQQTRAAQEGLDVPCAIDLPRVRSHPADERLEALVAAAQRLHAHGGQHLRECGEVDGFVRGEGCDCCRHCGPVDDGETLLRVEAHGRDASVRQGDVCSGSRSRGAEAWAGVCGGAGFALHDGADPGERAEVARC